jgi:hypothetical protein
MISPGIACLALPDHQCHNASLKAWRGGACLRHMRPLKENYQYSFTKTVSAPSQHGLLPLGADVLGLSHVGRNRASMLTHTGPVAR